MTDPAVRLAVLSMLAPFRAAQASGRIVTVYDLERIRKAEEKRARKSAKRGSKR